jgi:hypothetical protein
MGCANFSSSCLLFLTKDCAPPVPCIPSYMWTGPDPTEPPDPIFEPDIEVPIIPPIDLGCYPFSASATYANATGGGAGSLGVSTSFIDDDPCLPVFNLDITFPDPSGAFPACPTFADITTSVSTTAFGNAAVLDLDISYVAGLDPCEFSIDLSLEIPCGFSAQWLSTIQTPSWAPGRSLSFSMIETSLESCLPDYNLVFSLDCPVALSTSISYGVPSLYADRGAAPSLSFSVSHGVSAEDCDMRMDINLDFPHVCPPAFAVTTTPTDDWTTRTGDVTATFVKVGGNDDPGCDFSLDLNIDFPCALSTTGEQGGLGEPPALITVNTNNPVGNVLTFDALNVNLEDPWLTVNNAGVTSLCELQIDFGLKLPCTSIGTPTLSNPVSGPGDGFPIFNLSMDRIGDFYMSANHNTNNDKQCTVGLRGSLVLDAAAGGSGSSGGRYAEIISSIGTGPPYIYTGKNVPYLGNGMFGTATGADFFLWGFAEIGAGNLGVHEVPNGSIVEYTLDASGDALFERSFYRGTY